MFNELLIDLGKVTAPLVDLPEFINRNPLDLILTVSNVFDLSSDSSVYQRVVISEDGERIYVVYRGLKHTLDARGDSTAYISDTILFNGKICMINIIDSDMLFNNKLNSEILLDTVLVMVTDTVLFLKAKNVNMFYKKTNVLRSIFDQAPILLFVSLVLKEYVDCDKLRIAMTECIECMYDIKDLDINEYIELLKNNSIDFLLDNSVIATRGDSSENNKELAESEETI